MDDKFDINDARLAQQHDAAGPQPEPAPEPLARPLEVLDGAHIEIEVKPYAYSFLGLGYTPKSREMRNGVWKFEAKELQAYVETLRGISADIVYTRRWDCSVCGLGFEVDEETGLTACCGTAVAKEQALQK